MSQLLNKTRAFAYGPPGSAPITFQVGERTLDIGCAFEVWLQDRSLAAVRRQAEKLPAHEYQALLAGWRQECATGVYEIGAPLNFQALMSPSGQKEMTYLTLYHYNRDLSVLDERKVPQPAVTRELVEALYKDEKAWAEWCALSRALNDPNPKGEEATTPTPPPAPAA